MSESCQLPETSGRGKIYCKSGELVYQLMGDARQLSWFSATLTAYLFCHAIIRSENRPGSSKNTFRAVCSFRDALQGMTNDMIVCGTHTTLSGRRKDQRLEAYTNHRANGFSALRGPILGEKPPVRS